MMAENRFKSFVVFGEMRTGSNFLESNINQFPDLTCFGEAYNPSFIGSANKEELFGVTLREREKRLFRDLCGWAGFQSCRVPTRCCGVG